MKLGLELDYHGKWKVGKARLRCGVGELNGVNKSHWSVKQQVKAVSKSTCSDKRAELPDLSLGFPVTDEKSFVLGWFNERSALYLYTKS